MAIITLGPPRALCGCIDGLTGATYEVLCPYHLQTTTSSCRATQSMPMGEPHGSLHYHLQTSSSSCMAT